MSDFLVGLPLADPNLSGFCLSGGAQRRLMPSVYAEDVIAESRSSVDLVTPKSVRQARPLLETRIFFYAKVSVVA